MEILIFIGLAAVVVWLAGGSAYLQMLRAKRSLAGIPGYSPAYFYVDAEGSVVAVDTMARRIAFVDKLGTSSTFAFSDLIAVEACKNGISFTKTDRGSQIMAAVVGRALFGPIGFELGGHTGSTTTSERIRTLSLKIYVNDIHIPVREITFYRGTAIEMNSRKFRRCAATLDEWHARLNIVMIAPSPAPSRLRR